MWPSSEKALNKYKPQRKIELLERQKFLCARMAFVTKLLMFLQFILHSISGVPSSGKILGTRSSKRLEFSLAIRMNEPETVICEDIYAECRCVSCFVAFASGESHGHNASAKVYLKLQLL